MGHLAKTMVLLVLDQIINRDNCYDVNGDFG